MGRYHLFLLLVFVGVAASLPQKVETYLKTFYVAVTEVAFDSQPSVCISLINATRPCIGSGRSARMNPAPPPMVQRVEHTIDPKAFLSIDEETNNQDSIVMSSINDRSNRAEQPHQTGFFRLFTRGFSNALGLTRTLVQSVTSTRTMTTTYTETTGLTYLEIMDCIPPVLYYPICEK